MKGKSPDVIAPSARKAEGAFEWDVVTKNLLSGA
jgi:hypothetical protein